jgi:hypothetical protein
VNRLWLQLAWRRHGPLPWVAVVLALVALTIEAFALPRLEARTRAAAAEAADLTRRARAAGASVRAEPAISPDVQRLAAFEAVLLPAGGASSGIQSVLDRANKAGLTLPQAEYKWSAEAAGGYRVLELLVPVKGTYPQVLRLVDEVLADVPGAALDDLAFRRDSVAAAPEARLRFALFVRGEGR